MGRPASLLGDVIWDGPGPNSEVSISPLKTPFLHLHRTTIPQLSLCLFKRIPDNRAPVSVGALPVRFF